MFTKSLCIAAVTVSIATAAHATQRTFVSGLGSDGNTSSNCAHAAPCRTFAVAATITSPGGEIEALDPAGYGPITISGSLTLVGVPGAAINAAPNQDAIMIGAGPTDVVTLRGLNIIGSGGSSPGSHGITFTSGGTFNIQDCVVRDFANAGINLDPNGSTNFTFSDLVLANDGTNGIAVAPTGTGTTTRVYLERVVSSGNFGQMNNGTGFTINGSFSTGTINVTIVDSAAHSNSTGFFIKSSSAQATTNVTLVNVKAINNNTGINVGGTGPATAFLRHSTISGNPSDGYAVTSSGVLKSFGDNAVVDTTNLGNIAPLSLQ